MGRSPCCSKEGLNRGAWTAHEDKILTDYITLHGEGRWRFLPKRAGLKRCGKSCRLRWLNYLRPDIKRGNITPDEEELIIRLHKLLGNRWSLIAGRLPGRTDNEIKNYWNTNLGKKVRDGGHQNNINKSASMNMNMNSSNMIPVTPESNTTLPINSVVRTKASKCSKVFINPLLPPPISISSPHAPPDSSSDQLLKACHHTAFLSFQATEQERMSSSTSTSTDNLLADFNVGELCLSDLLNSDFSEMSHFTTAHNNNNNSSDSLSPSCADQPFVFSDEVLNDWTQTSAAQANLHSFTSFLESSDCEEWAAQ